MHRNRLAMCRQLPARAGSTALHTVLNSNALLNDACMSVCPSLPREICIQNLYITCVSNALLNDACMSVCPSQHIYVITRFRTECHRETVETYERLPLSPECMSVCPSLPSSHALVKALLNSTAPLLQPVARPCDSQRLQALAILQRLPMSHGP